MQTFKQLIEAITRIHQKGHYRLSENQVAKALQIEGLLYFNYLQELTDEGERLHLLLQGMHKLGKKDLQNFHFLLDVINQNYAEISGKQQFMQAMKNYESLEIELRLFNIDNIKSIKSDAPFYKERIAIYTDSFNKIQSLKNEKIPKSRPNIPFIEFDDRKIDLTSYELPSYSISADKLRKGGKITVTIQELKEIAAEMDFLVDENPNLSSQSYEMRMEKFQLLANRHYDVSPDEEIHISEVCHIVGMVGTGKSTLIQVLSYFLAKNNYRTMVLFESVKEVLEHTYLFEQFGIACTAINGERDQDNRVQKVIESYEMIVPEKYSSYLIGSCYISALSDGIYDNLDMYGQEPCYRMQYQDEQVICPFYAICPRKQNTRKMQNASLIFANVHSYLFKRSGPITDRGQLLLLEYAIDYMDVVIFDEADELQMKLDEVLNESSYTEEILKVNFEGLSRYIEETIVNGNLSVRRNLDAHFHLVYGGLIEMKSLLKNRSIKDAFQRIKNGQWFSAYVLAQNLDFLPTSFVEAYKQIIKGKDLTFLGIKNAYLNDEEYYQTAFEKLYKDFDIQSEHEKIVQCLMAMVITEKHMLSLQNEVEAAQKATGVPTKNQLPGIFRRPNEELLRLLPKSPTNNRFGFLFDEENNSLQIFKQLGIGRSAMLDLPYLKINENGQPLGPHTLLLSGSSYAAGSNAHHINRPVNYVLQAPEDILQFIEKVSIEYVKSEIVVSGARDKKAALADMINLHRQRFLKAQETEGRTLLIVNSYEQAEWVQRELKKIIPTGVFRIVPDHEVSTEETIQRSKLNQARYKDFHFLVAPAVSIARGFNMVDENGHSLFNKMFVLVRPMSKPKEIQNVVSIVNGELMWLMSKALHTPYRQKEFDQMQLGKNHAHKIWNVALQDFYGVQQANPLVKKNIVVSRLVLLMQLLGRLLRVTNLDATPPTIVLLDHAFGGQHSHSFDLLQELETYLEKEMQLPETGQLVEKLYGPFLKGLKRGKSLV